MFSFLFRKLNNIRTATVVVNGRKKSTNRNGKWVLALWERGIFIFKATVIFPRSSESKNTRCEKDMEHPFPILRRMRFYYNNTYGTIMNFMIVFRQVYLCRFQVPKEFLVVSFVINPCPVEKTITIIIYFTNHLHYYLRTVLTYTVNALTR